MDFTIETGTGTYTTEEEAYEALKAYGFSNALIYSIIYGAEGFLDADGNVVENPLSKEN